MAEDADIQATLQVVAGRTDNWLHVLHRRKAGRDVFLVCNQDHLGAAKNFRLRVTAPGEPECWDAMRNEISALPCRREGDVAEISLTLEPSESVLLVFNADKRDLPLRGDNKAPQCEIGVRNLWSPADNRQIVKSTVIKATYGIPGDPELSRDAREQLQRYIDVGIRQFQVKQLARFAGNDPAVNKVKTLQAEIRLTDKILTINARDNDTVALTDLPPSDRYEELQRSGKPFTAYQGQGDPFVGTADIPAAIDLADSGGYTSSLMTFHSRMRRPSPSTAKRPAVSSGVRSG